jgi:hypothetical protein
MANESFSAQFFRLSDMQGQTTSSITLGTTFEQPMAYPQKQMTIESCSYPAAGFTASEHMVKQTPSG